MSREYSISAGGINVAGATTLIGLRPGTTCALEILRMWISQSANVTSVQQRVEWGTQAVSGSPTFTGATPAKLKTGDPISQIVSGGVLAAGTAGVNASVESSGARTPMAAASFNVVSGWEWIMTPDDTIILSPGLASAFYLWLPVVPPTTAGWDCGLIYKELG